MSQDDRRPLVSVIMIFHNAERFISESIDSVLAQTYPFIELLLCDDGSTDSSTSIARSYVEAFDDRVRYLEHPQHAQRGMSSTRNLGAEAARGNLIAFLDSDDVWLARHLEHEVELLERYPEAAAVCGQCVNWHSWERPDAVDFMSPLPWPHGTLVTPPKMMPVVLRLGSYTTPTCNLLVRRDALLKAGGAESKFTGMFEDQVINAKLYLSFTCVISGSRTALYRRHRWSSSAVAERAGVYSPMLPSATMQAYLEWLQEYVESLEHEGRTDLAGVRAMIGDALRSYRRRPRDVAVRLARMGRARLTPEARRRVRALLQRVRVTGGVRFGSLRSTTPISRALGTERGVSIESHYVEAFLDENQHLIGGDVIEDPDLGYASRIQGANVIRSWALDAGPDSSSSSFVSATGNGPDAPFDCIIATRLHLVADLDGALADLHHALKPGGTLLATWPGIPMTSAALRDDRACWSLTTTSAQRLFDEHFGTGNVEVGTRGNVLSAVALLEGLATRDLRPHELAHVDPQFPVLFTVRALKPATDERL